MTRIKAIHLAMPLRLRAALLALVFFIAAGAGLMAYLFYSQPKTLSIAVGSFDGEGKQIANVIAGRLAQTESPVRLRVENAGTALDAAKAFAAGKADLAIVRADAGDLREARAVAVTAHGVAMIVAPPGSPITSIAKLRGHTVGVVGGEINHGLVEVLKKEYELGRANVTFKDIVPSDARRAVQAKEVQALLVVVPLTAKYLTFVKSLFQSAGDASPVLIPVDSAGAIAAIKGPYESFDIPKGTLRGAPAAPDDDVTSLRVGYYLVANRHLAANVVADLAKKVIAVRRDLVGEQPLLAGISAPDTDPDAFLPVHPGAVAFYNGTQEGFMDRYGNAIYLAPMLLGAIASAFAAAWRFLGVPKIAPAQSALDGLCRLPARIRKAGCESELAVIEDETDAILQGLLTDTTDREERDMPAAIAAASRIDNLIHQRRAMLAAGLSPKKSAAGLISL